MKQHQKHAAGRAIAVISNDTGTAINFRRELFLRMRDRGFRVLLYTPEADPGQLAELRSLGVEYRPFTLSRSISALGGDLAAAYRLSRDLKRERPELVLSTFLKPVIFGSLAARFAGVRRIYSMIEGLGYAFTEGERGLSLPRRILRKGIHLLLNIALHFNSRVFVLNRDDLSMLVDQRVLRPGQAVFLDGIGVDLAHFTPGDGQTDSFRFIYVGRMLKEKGVPELVEAASLLKPRYPDVRWQLLGGTDDNPGALSRDQLEAWQAEGIIEWLGVRSDVAALLRNSSVFVLPSWREGKPRSTMEAMACGLPVVTTDVPGCRETVEDGVNGYLVPVRQPKALAEAMEQFILQKERVGSMGAESLRMARSRFDVHRINTEILSELEIGESR